MYVYYLCRKYLCEAALALAYSHGERTCTRIHIVINGTRQIAAQLIINRRFHARAHFQTIRPLARDPNKNGGTAMVPVTDI